MFRWCLGCWRQLSTGGKRQCWKQEGMICCCGHTWRVPTMWLRGDRKEEKKPGEVYMALELLCFFMWLARLCWGSISTAVGSKEWWAKPGWKHCKGLICPQIQVHFLTMPWTQTVPTHRLVLAAPPVPFPAGRTVVCGSVLWAGWGVWSSRKITWHKWKIFFFQLHRLCEPLQCCGNSSKGE